MIGPAFANFVSETCTVVTNDEYHLDGADVPDRAFREAYPDGANRIYYGVRNQDRTKWELHYNETLAYGAPDTLSRGNVFLSTNSNLGIVWVADDLPLTLYVPTAADLLEALTVGFKSNIRGALLGPGARWWDNSAGDAVSWISKIVKDDDTDVRDGYFDPVKELFFPDNRTASVAVGAANKTFDASHAGGSFSFDTSAANRTGNLPTGSTVGDGYWLRLQGLSDANGVVLAPQAGDGIDGLADGVTKTIPGGRTVIIRWSTADDRWITNVFDPYETPRVRQTAISGPLTSTGLANFLPATATGLTVTAQNISGTTPLVLTAANGYSGAGGRQIDRQAIITSNPTWGSLTNTTTNFLYANLTNPAALTYGSTTLQPIYQWAGTPAVTNGQYTFNISEMKGYLGNGTTAPQTYLVFLGEAVTSGGNVTATVAYTYNGRYESSFTNTLPTAGVAFSSNHNLGVTPRDIAWTIENLTTEFNYAVGDQLQAWSIMGNPSNTVRPVAVSASRNSINVVATASNVGAWMTVNKNNGADVVLTPANWKHRFTAGRGW